MKKVRIKLRRAMPSSERREAEATIVLLTQS
jgi:hypothetical protein